MNDWTEREKELYKALNTKSAELRDAQRWIGVIKIFCAAMRVEFEEFEAAHTITNLLGVAFRDGVARGLKEQEK